MKDVVAYKKLIEKIENAPEKSGVYIFKNKKEYIYIGKAKNLKNRLKNHLQSIKIDYKEQKIFEQSTDLEWLITSSDYEAFVLENELIKQYKPKYNVRLKSGSSYPMLVITDEEYPTVKISRKFGEIKGEYFGPFIPARTARAMKELIHKIFKLRTCETMPKKDMICFDYHLGLCSAPCGNKISEKEYNLDVKSAKAFLSGNVKKIIYELYDRINEYTEKMLFEKAAVVRDQITALENIVRKQQVVGIPEEEADIFYFFNNELYIVIVRGNRILGKDKLKIENIEKSDIPIAIIDYYKKGNFIPKKIVVNINFEDLINLKQWIKQVKNKEVIIDTDIISEIKEFIKRNIENQSLNLDILEKEFKKVFGFNLPKRIDGFDISTLQGNFNVGSCVIWEKGKMNKRKYRRYKIKTVKGVDDYSSMREMLYRRLRKYKEEENPPELLLIDGGKGHLKQGLIVKDALGIKDLRIFSIAKKEEIIYTDDNKQVHLYEYPLLLRLFTTIRDEAHRFAISYNRKLREKEGLKSVLDNVEGIGKKRKEILYRTYKTIDNIALASEKELVQLGIPLRVAQNLKKYLNNS
ncbi:excinuclease ABC subunit UvrC [Hydrogenothermus marinus]|uniref:UvrABC system protein C n=1 Tax=Hydrogenothermus marinus TaxID=133270 RepID=A0A3M0B9T6_9AQUI|nr:excinuclease ABC subunit UvrC [Hydrogenothermus marinus]RMA93244.1 excinuclease ABC subunit C [Hydrogenothermus marinus]